MRAVKTLQYRSKLLPFVFSLHLFGGKGFSPRYPAVNLIDSKKIEGIALDLYLPTGRKRRSGVEPGRLYIYDQKFRQVRSKIEQFEYEYKYDYSIQLDSTN